MVKALRRTALVLTLIIIGAAMLAGCGGKSNDDVVAMVNNTPITVGYFEAKWAKLASNDPNFEPVPGKMDSLREEVLSVLINKELIVEQARKEGYLDDPVYLDAYKGQANHRLIELLKDKEVIDRLPEFTEEDFLEHHKWLGYKAKVRHIDMDLENAASDLVKRLRDGELSFNEAVLQYSTNQDRSSGGDMGTVAFGSKIRAVEEALFTMEAGQISDPIKTPYGYGIFIVDEITKTEPDEYVSVRASIKNRLEMRAMREVGAAHSQRVLKKYGFEFNWDNAERIVVLMPDDLTPSQVKAYRRENHEKPILKFSDEELEMVLYKVKGEEFTLRLFSDEYDRLHPFARPNKAARLQGIYNWVHQQVIGDLMPLEARSQQYDQDPDFIVAMKEYQEQMCIGAVRKVLVMAPLSVNEAEARVFYDEKPLSYTLREQINCKQIITDDEEEIHDAWRRLEAGDDVEDVGRDISIVYRRSWISPTFVADSTMAPDNEAMQNISRLKTPGEYTEPFFYQGYWGVMMLNEVFPPRLQDFEDIKDQVMADLKEIKANTRMDSLLDVWRDDTNIEIKRRMLAKTEMGPEYNKNRDRY